MKKGAISYRVGTMIFEIKKANRTDLIRLVSFVRDDKPVIDKSMIEKFDEILSQTNHSVLLAEAQGEIIGTLSVSVIDGVGSDFPFAVVGGGKIKPEFKNRGVDEALISQARYIAAGQGCTQVR